MIVIDGNLVNLQIDKKAIALTMGVFDGVHRGHVDLINQLKKVANKKEIATGIMSFYPHPNQVIGNKKYPGDLLTKEERIKKISNMGVDYLYLQDFSLEFSNLDQKDFLRQFIQEIIAPKALLFGYDFKFGKNGLGNYELAKLALKNCDVSKAGPTLYGDEIVSSSKIRKLLMEGEVTGANNYLGYNYRLSGQVIEGLKIGRTLGFPTANLSNIKTLIPGKGVYSGYAVIDEKKIKAIMNIGTKPTVQNNESINCECHVFDFNQEIYGKHISFEFINKIRDEKKFPNLNALKEQINIDIDSAKRILRSYES